VEVVEWLAEGTYHLFALWIMGIWWGNLMFCIFTKVLTKTGQEIPKAHTSGTTWRCTQNTTYARSGCVGTGVVCNVFSCYVSLARNKTRFDCETQTVLIDLCEPQASDKVIILSSLVAADSAFQKRS
jgi:hypothetical protein